MSTSSSERLKSLRRRPVLASWRRGPATRKPKTRPTQREKAKTALTAARGFCKLRKSWPKVRFRSETKPGRGRSAPGPKKFLSLISIPSPIPDRQGVPLSGLYAPTVVERISGSVVRAVIEGQPVSFFVTTELDTVMGQNAYGYFYEIEELAIIARHFRPGSIMLDVGANIGNHTIYAAKFLGARRIICIEPNPEAIMILRINVDLNQLHEQVDMRYLGLGLSDSSGAAVIARTIAMNLGGATLASQAGGSIRLFAGDELLQGQPIDFIKIDVEGMELAVLKGLERTIAECRPGIFVEVDNAHAPAFHALIQHLGYDVVDRFNRYGTMENFMLVPSEINAIITPKAPRSS